MKLRNVYDSRQTWQCLTALKMPPKTAWKLLKYAKGIQVDSDLIDVERIKYLREASGVSEGDVSIEPGTPEMAAFFSRFDPFLETESDLKPLDMKMGELIEALGSEQGNVLSIADLAVVEPFFEV